MLMKKKAYTSKNKSLADMYEELCLHNKLEDNIYQRELLNHFQKLVDRLENDRPFQFFSSKNDSKGLYVWGDVGRGKTFLMDMFFNQLHHTKKRRVHFHEFMKEVHSTLHLMNENNEGGLPEYIKKISSEVRLLFLDEFQVTNIADAMLMARLFEGFFQEGIVVAATSNTSPTHLYENGLHRDRFLPFIPLLLENIDTFHLKGNVDYRRQKFSGQKLYFSPCDATAMNALREIWKDLTEDAPLEEVNFMTEGPPLTLEGLSRGVAWAHFQDLCAQPCGRLAYLSLAESIHTLILWGIPQMTSDDHNEAVRFTILIDILYDKGVWIAAAGDVEPENLYKQGGSFDRTISRLHEMQHGRRNNQ